MAGKRQHYVPRLLQRGFLHDPSEEAERTWLHLRGARARLVGIRDIGVEDWFYSRQSVDGAPTLDDVITDLERDLSAIVNNFRSTSPASSVNSDVAARCVVHLVMRTDHLRRVMSEGVSGLAGEIQALFTDPSRLGAMMGLNAPGLAPLVSDAIRNAAADLAPAGISPALSERLMSFQVRELGDDLVEQAATTLRPLFPHLFDGLAGKVQNAHNKILETHPESSGWVASLAGFQWTIQAGENLILPDAVALAAEEGGRLMPLLFTNASDAKAVVMPVSVNRILVGVQTGQDMIDITQFNQQAATCCRTFFIGAQPFDDEKFSSLIGTGPAAAIQNAIAEAVTSAELGRANSLVATAEAHEYEVPQQGFAYSVRLVDYGDEVLAKELGDIIQSVVSELSRHLPLYDLDGFTLAINYQQALASLDRGDASLPPVTSEALEYGIGVAMPVTVIRDGIRKEHIVIDAGIAKLWLSPDIEIRAGALNILVKMLAGVAHTTRYARETAITFHPDPMAAELHLGIATTPSGYFSARESAFVAPDIAQSYADLVLESLEFAEREIATERARITETGDVSNVTRRAFECVSATLTHAADWLGHRAGLADGQDFAGNDLPTRLRSRGLGKWLELFGRDLASIYDTPDGSLNMSVVTGLSQHVERLLWTLGVYAWPEGDGIQCLVAEQGFVPPQIA